MSSIRVGMIGADLHALYFGAQMFQYDPVHMRQHGRGYGALYYHYVWYDSPTVMTTPFVGGFSLVKAWDEDPDRAQALAECFDEDVQICDSPEECSEGVDVVFIPDCNGDGSTHLELARPGLEKGVPTYVDKPFASTLADARAMIELAQDNDTPVMSLSMLRVVPDGAHFRDRLQEIEPVGYGSVKGGGTTLAGQIHAISLAQQIFGAGVAVVDCMGPNDLSYMHLDYGGRADRPEAGVMLNCDSGPTWHCSLYVSAFGAKGAIHSGPIGDFQFPFGSAEILRRVKKMVETGKPQAPYEEMVECIAVIEAARIAQKTGTRAQIEQVMNETD